jgi:uncharacterized damage-inducible protein DinB
MLSVTLSEIFERDLLRLKEEISLYKSENDLWKVLDGTANSGGNLCLHLVGNLNHFIGSILGNSGYKRDRDSEFSSKDISREKLTQSIDETIPVVKHALHQLSPEDFEKNFPVEKHGKIVRTDFMLLHLVTHFNYHLGQVNYHRRMISG